MQLSADSPDTAAFRRKLETAARQMPGKAAGLVRATGQRMEAKTKQQIMGGGYSPRDPVDTGNMAGSVGVIGQTEMSVTVAVTADYAVHVNYGTWKMPARPFWTDSVDAVSEEFRAGAQALVKDLLP